MTKRFVVLLAAALVAATPSAIAQERLAGVRGARHVLPAYEILTIIRSTGFEPIGRPIRRGRRYEVDAIDPYDADVRLVVNARTGRIIAVRHLGGPGLGGPGLGGPGLGGPGLGGPEFHGPDFPREDYAQNGSRWHRPSWSGGRSREPRLVPPRSIPSSRSAALGPKTTPLPRPRPDGQAVAATTDDDVEVTGSIGSTRSPGSRDTSDPKVSTAPKTKTDSVAANAAKNKPIDIVPVVPLF